MMNTPCTVNGDCSSGESCRDGRCQPAPDALGAGDATVRDAPMMCPPERLCGRDCCELGQECYDGLCLPICPEVRCGPMNTCCDAGQLCLSDACVTPGDNCEEDFDCPVEYLCEPDIARCLPRSSAERCEYFPEPGVFVPTQQWAWTESTTVPASVHVMMTPVTGDLDGDGIPEVVFNTYNATQSYGGPGVLRVVRGDTGEEIFSVSSPAVCPEHGVALGDLDGDGSPEIVTLLSPCGNGRMAAFASDGALVWQSRNPDGTPWSGNLQFGAPSIADLDGDGRAEIVIGGEVLEYDGTLRWSRRRGAASNCCTDAPRSALSTVYDIDADGSLEIVAGNIAWEADGTLLWERAGESDGFVAIGDFFADDMPDVVVVAAGTVRILRGSDGEPLWGPITIPGGGRGGPPTVADFDDDGLPEIGVAGAGAYSVFDPMEADGILWSQVTEDQSSNITGSSVFDFDGDGSSEVVYNDECFMRIYRGRDGMVLSEVPQHSHTLVEYPVIADVDADGNAEILFAGNAAVNTCSRSDGLPRRVAGVRVFQDSEDNWVGTRPVWNQHTYHVTNIRLDLSVPTTERPNWRRFNSFRRNPQSFDAPNLQPREISADATRCPAALELRAQVTNTGAVTVSGGLAVSFYSGMEGMESSLLGTARTVERLLPGAATAVALDVEPAVIETGRGFPWFVRVDDVGDGSGEHNECIETDNVASAAYDCLGVD